MIRILSDIGWRRPLHFGMLGMVLMSGLDPNNVFHILQKDPLQAHTPFSITDVDAFSLRLAKIRHQDCALEKEEAVEGAIGIAAPIKDFSRRIVAALGIALPIGQRHDGDGLERMAKRVKKTCETISSDYNYLRIYLFKGSEFNV